MCTYCMSYELSITPKLWADKIYAQQKMILHIASYKCSFHRSIVYIDSYIISSFLFWGFEAGPSRARFSTDSAILLTCLIKFKSHTRDATTAVCITCNCTAASNNSAVGTCGFHGRRQVIGTVSCGWHGHRLKHWREFSERYSRVQAHLAT